MGIKRTYIGIYSKLRIGICIPNRYEKDVVKMLINKKYTFSKMNAPKLKLIALKVNVDSIEEAYKLKKKIHKICKIK